MSKNLKLAFGISDLPSEFFYHYMKSTN